MSDLPAGWRLVRLGDVADCSLGKMLDRGKPRGHAPVPYLRNTNVQWGQIRLDDVASMELAPGEIERYSVKAGDMLVCEGGEIGRAAIWPAGSKDIGYQKALHRVRSRGEVDLRYLRYLLEAHAQSGVLMKYSTGSTIKHLPQQQLKILPVPLAPLAEQRRIVDVLEDHLSRLDAAAGSFEGYRRRLDALNLSHLTQVRRTLLDGGSLTVRLGEVCDSTLGKMLDAKSAVGIERFYLRNINVRWGAFDLNDVKTMPMIDADARRLNILDGDVLVCEGGEPGRCAVWRGYANGMTFQKALHRLRVKNIEQIRPLYLSLMLEEHVRSGRVKSMLTGTTIKHLPQEKLRQVEVPDAPIEVQEMVERGAEKNLDAVRRLAAEIDRARTRGAALRRALLAAAFSGRLTGASTDTEAVEEIADSQAAS